MPYTTRLVSGIRLDHIAIALHRMADAPALLVGLLGAEPYMGMDSGAFRFGQWEFAGGGRIEILEPRGVDGFLHRFLAARGPGIHHVTFKVPSLREACDRAAALGYGIVGYNDANPHWREAFLHPREALGIVVQIAQASSWTPTRGRWRTAPPGPADPPPAVTLVGLRTTARSLERAEVQWSGLLGGRATREDGGVVYRWPGSPLRIAVDLDATGEEGAIAIEFDGPAGEAPDDLPADWQPLLARFVDRRTGKSLAR